MKVERLFLKDLKLKSLLILVDNMSNISRYYLIGGLKHFKYKLKLKIALNKLKINIFLNYD